MPREPTLGELAEDIHELKSAMSDGFRDVASRFDNLPYVRQDLYEAKHSALRHEVASEMAQIRVMIEAASGKAQAAQTMSKWVLGFFAVVLIGAAVALLVGATTGTAP